MVEAISAGRLILDNSTTRLRAGGQLLKLTDLSGNGPQGPPGPAGPAGSNNWTDVGTGAYISGPVLMSYNDAKQCLMRVEKHRFV